MKNNIRYKGNTINTSVTIFLSQKSKAPSDGTLLGRTSEEVFVMLLFFISFLIFISFSYFHFRFRSSFHFWSSLCCCALFVVFLHFTFSFRRHPSPFRGLSPGFYTQFYTFSPVHRRVIRDIFIFNHSVIFLPRALRSWVDIFYHQAFFTLCSFTDSLTCVYQGVPGSRQFFIGVCRASYWLILETQTRPICLFDSQ